MLLSEHELQVCWGAQYCAKHACLACCNAALQPLAPVAQLSRVVGGGLVQGPVAPSPAQSLSWTHFLLVSLAHPPWATSPVSRMASTPFAQGCRASTHAEPQTGAIFRQTSLAAVKSSRQLALQSWKACCASFLHASI